MGMKRLLGLGMAGLVVLGLCPTLPAEEARETLVVGLQDFDIFPYGRPDTTDTYVGYFRDLLDHFAADQGYRLELLVLPPKRLHLGFKRSEADLYIPDNPHWSRAEKEGLDMAYSERIAVALDGFMVLPGRENEALGEGIARIGTPRGVTLVPLQDAVEKGVVVPVYSPDFEETCRNLFLGRVDAVFSNVAVTRHALGGLGKPSDAVVWSRTLPRSKAEYHVATVDRPELIEQIDAWLRDHPDKVTALKKRYGLLDAETTDWGR